MEKTIKRLSEVFKQNLLSLYSSDLEKNPLLIIFLKKADFFRLEKARSILKKQNFVILSSDDLKDGGDVFPVEFLRFKMNTVHLKGKDVLSELKIQKKFLRPHLEYELRNKRVFLRMEYLSARKGKDFLPLIMPTFIGFADSLLFLKSVRKIEELSIEEKLEQVQKKYEVDMTVFFQLLAFQDKGVSSRLAEAEIPAMIQSVDIAFYELIEKINNL